MIIIATGTDSKLNDKEVVEKSLAEIPGHNTIIHRGKSEVDQIIDTVARKRRWNVIVSKEDPRYGELASDINNSNLINDRKANLILLFKIGEDEKLDTLERLAKQKRIKVLSYNL